MNTDNIDLTSPLDEAPALFVDSSVMLKRVEHGHDDSRFTRSTRRSIRFEIR